MELEKEFKEIIKKNLPQHVGEALKERLEQADKDAIDIVAYKSRIEQLVQESAKQQTRILEYKKADERNSLLDSREKELETKERNLKIEQLTYQLETEKDKVEYTKSVALGLVRNTQFRKNILDSECHGGLPVIDGQGNHHYPMPTSKSYLETREEL